MRKSLAVAFGIVAVGVAVVGNTTAQQGPIKIGVITTLTGRLAEFGKQQKAGFEVALKELNSKGTQKYEMLLEDSASDVNKGLAAAEKLVNAGVGVILN